MPPDSLHDDVLGEVRYDPPMRAWWAEVALTPERRIDVTIWWDEPKDGPFDLVLDRARTAVQRFVRQEREHRQALATAILGRWWGSVPAGQAVPDPERIVNGLTASQVTISPDGSASVDYHDAAELFGDHSIVVDLDAAGAFMGFSLHG